VTPATLHPLLAVVVGGLVLAGGAVVVGALDAVVGAAVAGDPRPATAGVRAWRRVVLAWRRPGTVTERPDLVLWVVAPAAYVGVAALALAVLPLGDGIAIADVRTGIVVFGAVEVLAMVAVFLHGWAANSALALVGAYRFVAESLSFLLLSMFVLIAAALPAESMAFGEIVASQQGLWNVVRQPLGLPLFTVVALGTTFWGPLNLPDGADIATGTSLEVGGPAYIAWQVARRAMLAVYAIATSVVFLGGHLGPVLPGPVWLALKSVVVASGFVWLGHRVGRVPMDRFVRVAWTVLLPLSFLHLAVTGAVVLL